MDAVLAAAAIPGVLPPVRQGDRLLVDGGVVNNTPISHAVELGAERIYVLATKTRPRARFRSRPAARSTPRCTRSCCSPAPACSPIWSATPPPPSWSSYPPSTASASNRLTSTTQVA
jgi:predicted acylesterase/phospholipase RssA